LEIEDWEEERLENREKRAGKWVIRDHSHLLKAASLVHHSVGAPPINVGHRIRSAERKRNEWLR
jgi:hypothetical protein